MERIPETPSDDLEAQSDELDPDSLDEVSGGGYKEIVITADW